MEESGLESLSRHRARREASWRASEFAALHETTVTARSQIKITALIRTMRILLLPPGNVDATAHLEGVALVGGRWGAGLCLDSDGVFPQAGSAGSPRVEYFALRTVYQKRISNNGTSEKEMELRLTLLRCLSLPMKDPCGVLLSFAHTVVLDGIIKDPVR